MRVDIITSITVVIVKFKPSDFQKYGRSYKTSNRSKVLYINTHPHQTRVSSTIFFFFYQKEKVGVLEFKREKLT